ncbi:hypothetical protein DFJ63DRAFT_333529 [Scheffersomyces coipomensis]|uniref:uncharacterized protein n=1 Tax=Scheffersomyces coipomensis TaxID=1788519 RepID=UPI00315DBD23
MKLSHSALLAILVSSAFVSAAPAVIVNNNNNSLIKRTDINEVLEIIEELKTLNQKRDLIEGSELEAYLSKRDSAVGDLLTALLNSGIISDIWTAFTTNSTITAELKTIISSAIKGALVEGPALISAIWNSGLIKQLFDTLINDSDLKTAFLAVAKSIFTTGLNLVKAWLGLGSSSTATTAAASTASAAAKREVLLGDSEFIDKRDVLSVVETVVEDIYNSGLVQDLFQKVVANPTAVEGFLSSALKYGVVAVEDVYGWAKSSGVLAEGLTWIENNGGKYAADIASFLGDQIAAGNVTTSDIDNASTSSSTSKATTITSTAAAAAALLPAAIGGAATTATPATVATINTATPVATNNNAVLASLEAAYGGTNPTTAATVAVGDITNDVNTLVNAASQIAGSLKKRRIAY